MFRTCAIALILAGATACGDRPEEVMSSAFRALETGELDAVLDRVEPSYTDPLGDKARLAADLRHLIESTGSIEVRASELSTVEGRTRQEARVIGRLDVELTGTPTWRMTGPLELDLRREGGFHITGGFLTDLRDVMTLAAERRAALEGNDPERYTKLLHPTYRDGDADREATEAKIARDLGGRASIRLDPSLYVLEVRGPLAHLDEQYLLKVNERALPPAIARLTLRPAAGFWRIAAGLYPEDREER